MFITLTFVDTAKTAFNDRTINAAEISSFVAQQYHDGERLADGTKITYTDVGRSHSIVTALPNQIAEALGAADLRS